MNAMILSNGDGSAKEDTGQLDRRSALKLLGAGGAVTLGGHALLGRAAAAAESAATPVSSGPTLSEKIADYIIRSRFQDVPPAVIRKAKEQIVYFFGRAFEISFLEPGRQMRQVVQPIASQSDGASVIGHRLRLTPSDAAFANASLCGWSLGLDDALVHVTLHPGVLTLPTALAVGEIKHVSGRELLLALVQGYEVLGKLGRAGLAWQAPLPRRSGNIYGGFGPVTVAGRLLGLDRTKMANALGYAAHLCMGLAEGSMMDHYFSLISRNGTFAAQLAEAGGIPYSKLTLEGELGLYRSFFGKVPEELPKLIDELGYSEILLAVQKRYPGTAVNTTPIELFAAIVSENRLTQGEVASVQARVPAPGAKSRERHLSSSGPFTSPHFATGSLKYCLARTLLDGKIDAVRYEDPKLINADDAVQAMQKIEVVFDPKHAGQWAHVSVRTVDGRKFERESDLFMYPFPPEVWGDWLRASGSKLLPDQQLTRLQELITNLEDVDDVAKLMAAATPPPGTK